MCGGTDAGPVKVVMGGCGGTAGSRSGRGTGILTLAEAGGGGGGGGAEGKILKNVSIAGTDGGADKLLVSGGDAADNPLMSGGAADNLLMPGGAADNTLMPDGGADNPLIR